MSGKFIQIATDTEGLYALDGEGNVWKLVYRTELQRSRWVLLSEEREPPTKEGASA